MSRARACPRLAQWPSELNPRRRIPLAVPERAARLPGRPRLRRHSDALDAGLDSGGSPHFLRGRGGATADAYRRVPDARPTRRGTWCFARTYSPWRACSRGRSPRPATRAGSSRRSWTQPTHPLSTAGWRCQLVVRPYPPPRGELTTGPQAWLDSVAAPAAASPPGKTHAVRPSPAGLATLFFTEMWERFTSYGMRAILILFMVATASGDGGLGIEDKTASSIYGLFVAACYLLSLLGGWKPTD